MVCHNPTFVNRIGKNTLTFVLREEQINGRLQKGRDAIDREVKYDKGAYLWKRNILCMSSAVHTGTGNGDIPPNSRNSDFVT